MKDALQKLKLSLFKLQLDKLDTQVQMIKYNIYVMICYERFFKQLFISIACAFPHYCMLI